MSTSYNNVPRLPTKSIFGNISIRIKCATHQNSSNT